MRFKSHGRIIRLTDEHDDNSIKVSFSVDDLNNVDEDADPLQDEEALGDELDEMHDGSQKNINQTSSPGNARMTSEDRIAPSDREDEGMDDAGEQEPSFPAHVSITVERPGKGALEIQTVAQDGVIAIDSVHYFKDAKLVNPKSPEDTDTAASLYTGPPFNNLDEDLQILFEKFLDERGINTTMALFIPEYIDFKEQNEYLGWLSGEQATRVCVWHAKRANPLLQDSSASSTKVVALCTSEKAWLSTLDTPCFPEACII